MSYASGILQVLPTIALTALGPLVALILILTRAGGRIRTVGAVGAVLLLLTTIAGGLLNVFLPALLQRFDLRTSAIGLLTLPTNVIGWVGTVVLGIAVVIRPSAAASTQPPHQPQGPR